MSTFSPQKPAPGWEKRWPKEAAQLILRTPLIIMVFLAVSLGAGFLETLPARQGVGLMMHFMFILFVGGPLLAWLYHALGKHEKYIYSSFTGYGEVMKMSWPAVIIILILIAILLPGMMSETANAESAYESRLQEVFSNANFIITSPMIFLYQGMFTFLVVSLVNAGPEENRIIAIKAQDKLKEVLPHIALQSFFALLLLRIFLPPFVVTGFIIFFYYMIYVAGREIIGGITGNAEESKAPVLAPT